SLHAALPICNDTAAFKVQACNLREIFPTQISTEPVDNLGDYAAEALSHACKNWFRFGLSTDWPHVRRHAPAARFIALGNLAAPGGPPAMIRENCQATLLSPMSRLAAGTQMIA